MTKEELVKAVSSKTGMSSIDTKKCIDEVFNSMREALSDGNKITIKNFGTFLVHEKKARDSFNPLAGVPIRLEARKRIKFRPSPTIKVDKNKK